MCLRPLPAGRQQDPDPAADGQQSDRLQVIPAAYRAADLTRKDTLMATGKMHADEVHIDGELVRRLIAEQFPRWADLPISAVQSTATVNAIYRLGDHLYARLPRVQEWAKDLDKEWHWLPEARSTSVAANSRACW